MYVGLPVAALVAFGAWVLLKIGAAATPASADGDETPMRGVLGLGCVSICVPLLYAFEKKLPTDENKFGMAGFATGAGAGESDAYDLGAVPATGFASAEHA